MSVGRCSGGRVAVLSEQAVGLVLDRRCDVGERVRVGASVVAAEEKLTVLENNTNVRLGRAPVTPVGSGQRFSGHSSHTTM